MHAHLTVKKQGMIVISQKSKSFLIGFCGLMIRQWCQSDDTLDDTGGNSRTENMGYMTFNCISPGGYGLLSIGNNLDYYQEIDRHGIVIGSGTGTVVPNDYGLGTQIRSGEKAGTILHCGTGVYGLTVDAGSDTGSFKVLGIFHNVSGGSIDVKEVGIYCHGDVGNVAHPNIFDYDILRDNISTISLADEEFLEVEYTISIAT